MAVGRVVIVGAGPAGAALAYLLARRGIAVTLLERHSDFGRTFRGDGLQPSGIDAFNQMGLGDKLMRRRLRSCCLRREGLEGDAAGILACCRELLVEM